MKLDLDYNEPIVMIHSCNKRLWYVREYLIPYLITLGIPERNIILWNDYKGIGCLKQWVSSCEYLSCNIKPGYGVWHLQDDVLPSKDFYEFAKAHSKDIICNGFVSKKGNSLKYTYAGHVNCLYNWMSFPCMYIPVKYTTGFYKWFIDHVITQGKYSKFVANNRYDDMLFWNYMHNNHRDITIHNVVPALIQHIDYLIGGTTINFQYTGDQTAYYWNDVQLKTFDDLKAYIQKED